jgi:hypothetical protein
MVRKQHRSSLNESKELAGKPIIVSFSGRQRDYVDEERASGWY